MASEHVLPFASGGPAGTANQPWRQRMELGLRITDELGPGWVILAGDDFLGRLELAIALTLELAEDWVAIYRYCGQAAGPVGRDEIVVVLDLDAGIVTRCLDRLREERLIKPVGSAELFRLRTRLG